jgi:hypothetical protein
MIELMAAERSRKQSRRAVLALVWGGPLGGAMGCASSRHSGRPASSEGVAAMQDLFEEVRHVSVSVRRPPGQVYEYASQPENLPKWAAGLAGSFERRGERWVAKGGPLGEVEVSFAPSNEFGVLDHAVTLPDGETVHNALRVIPNAQGSEVVFTVFRRPGMSRDQFEKDAAAVKRDLDALKALVEEHGE